MKKRISSFLLLFLLFAGLLSSCSKDNEILATSSIKDITREDFYNWLDAKKIEKESIMDSKNKQINLLEKMALELFIMNKANVEGFDKSRRLMILKERTREAILKKYFKKTVTDILTYDEPAIRVSYIILEIDNFKPNPDDKSKRIRLEPQEIANKIDDLLLKSRDIINKLDKGESFEKLASEFSEDSNKKNGGDMGYIYKEMMPAYFSDPAFRLNKGEYTKTPVVTPKGIYIIKVTDKTKLTEKNIDNIIEDRKQRDRIKALLDVRYQKKYLAELEKADDVKFYYKKGNTYSNTDVLFKIGSNEYTITDIEKLIEKRATPEELDKMYKNGSIPDNTKFNFVEQCFKNLVWSREALRLGVDKLPEYLKELKEREINIVVAEYLMSRFSNEIIISDQEIMEEYEKEKETKYSDKVMENGVVVNKPVPLDVVKDEIIDKLKKDFDLQRANNWRKTIFEEYTFKINEAALQGN
ncbi:MAG: peptidylprolyl isomerase [Deltaproteobacteria bacterium]|nr:peptidylprolyl isomerase [Deltaproteobacteria bacterium]